MRMSHSSLALLLVALSATLTSSYLAPDGSSSTAKLPLRRLLQLAPDAQPSHSDDANDTGASSPLSTPGNTATDTPPSPSDDPIDTGASPPSSTPGSVTGASSQNVPADSTSPAVGSPPPASGNNTKLTIIIGTSVPSSLILTTVLVLARRHHKRKSATTGKKGQVKGSNGTLVEVAVNIGSGAAKH